VGQRVGGRIDGLRLCGWASQPQQRGEEGEKFAEHEVRKEAVQKRQESKPKRRADNEVKSAECRRKSIVKTTTASRPKWPGGCVKSALG
jgi:hypothetical protein